MTKPYHQKQPQNNQGIQNLVVQDLPLAGKHLIEASAGTGKTYNITRIYIRLLLEKKLEVNQILVMTFTKAATQELRGRIRAEIARAAANWGEPNDEPFYVEMQTRYEKSEALPLLNRALLHMDEASIFTIHGFCATVLSQYAFECQIDLSMTMEADTQALEIQSVYDFYRRLAKAAPERYQALATKWATPELFYQSFAHVINKTSSIFCASQESLIKRFLDEKTQALDEITANQTELHDAIIKGKKDADKRTQELNTLIDWLSLKTLEPMPKMARDFLNGNRYRKAENKALIELTAELKDSQSTMIKAINDSLAFEIATDGLFEIRSQITKAKFDAKLMSFDDLILHLFNSLNSDPNVNDVAHQLAARLVNDYPVALVDEFQDTDPQQYGILSSIYRTAADAGLIMIGDPKQAIYGFRGGDINAYLTARQEANSQWLLDTNWRSTPEMISAYNRLFYGRALPQTDEANQAELALTNEDFRVFGQGIEYHPVKSGQKQSNLLSDPHLNGALIFDFFEAPEAFQNKQKQTLASFRPTMAQHCANEISRLLATNGQTSTLNEKDTVTFNGRSVVESNIAILVRSGSEAQEIERALSDNGISCVYQSAKENVFESLQASELLVVLNGIVHNHDLKAMISALATPYFNYSAQALYQLQHDEALFEQARQYFAELADLWQQRSFMAMALKLIHEKYQPRRGQHERQLTNTMHLLELLQQASNQHQTPLELIQFLQQEICAPNKAQEYELRLESDEKLVKIVTQHGSKGLEYPIVFVPFASRYADPSKAGVSLRDSHDFYDATAQQKRTLIGQQEDIIAQAKIEQHLESVRLLYVAITRAEYRCYLGVTAFDNSHLSPLGCCLGLADATSWQAQLNELAQSQPNEITLNVINEPLEGVSTSLNQLSDSPEKNKLNTAQPAVFTGKIERNWWLSSFSALTRNLRHGGGVSMPEHHDDSSELSLVSKASLPLRFALKKGADAGNFLHNIFELIDFSQPDYAEILPWQIEKYGELPDGYTLEDLSLWCDEVLTTPLPSLDDNMPITLSQLSPVSVVKEAEFYFPMEDTQLSNLARVLTSYRNKSQQFDLISLPGRQTIQGMLHGFIDLIFTANGKYYVVDYKSTHLGNHYENYNVSALKANLEKSYYDLQYLLYSLALHRFLKSRMPNYDFEQHFGGVYYLYLRGMAPNNESETANHGIYAKKLDVGTIVQLDNVFSGQAINLDELNNTNKVS